MDTSFISVQMVCVQDAWDIGVVKENYLQLHTKRGNVKSCPVYILASVLKVDSESTEVGTTV